MREFDMQEVLKEATRIKNEHDAKEAEADEVRRLEQRLRDQCYEAVLVMYPGERAATRALGADALYKQILTKDAYDLADGEELTL